MGSTWSCCFYEAKKAQPSAPLRLKTAEADSTLKETSATTPYCRYAFYLVIVFAIVFSTIKDSRNAYGLFQNIQSTTSSSSRNDHIYLPIEKLLLNEYQLSLIKESLASKKLQNKDMLVAASASGVRITPHLLFRYYQSSEWAPTFYGKRWVTSNS